MCLETLEKVTSKKRKYGWKVFWVNPDGKLYPVCVGMKDGVCFPPINEWCTDNNEGYLLSGYGYKYKTGFHIFLRKEDAESFRAHPYDIVHKVEFKKVVAQGKQWLYKTDLLNNPTNLVNCVVAREIRILPQKGDSRCARKKEKSSSYSC